MRAQGEAVLARLIPAAEAGRRLALSCAMAASLAKGDQAHARELWKAHAPLLSEATRKSFLIRLLVAHAEGRP